MSKYFQSLSKVQLQNAELTRTLQGILQQLEYLVLALNLKVYLNRKRSWILVWLLFQHTHFIMNSIYFQIWYLVSVRCLSSPQLLIAPSALIGLPSWEFKGLGLWFGIVHLHKQPLPSSILKANLSVLHLPLKIRTGTSQSAASN